MLRNLENNVIFRAIITKKILHNNKKKVYIKFYELFSCFPVFRFSAAFPFWDPFLAKHLWQIAVFN